MAIVDFPSISEANEDGLLAIGGDLEIASLHLAYSRGIFPWPISKTHPLAWFSPDPRGALYLKDLHFSRSLLKEIKRFKGTVTFNKDFETVIRKCAMVARKDQSSTWIIDEMIQAYLDFHKAGYAYSVEVWEDDQLTGGIYGVHIGKFIAGESMFYEKTNASKIAFYYLMEKLRSKDIHFYDTQMITPVTKSFGAIEIPRDKFILELSTLINKHQLKL